MNNFNHQGNNGMFNPQNQNMGQNNNFNQQPMFNSTLNNNMYQQPVNQNNIPNTNPTNNSPKQNKTKIIGIVVAVVVVLFVGIMLFGGKGSNEFSGGSKNGTTIEQGEELNVKNNFSDITFKVVSVEKNIKLSSVLGALNNEVETFTKIKIDITNHRDKNTDIGTRNLLKLLDSNKNDVTNGTGCYAKTWMGLYESVTDSIDSTLLANSATSGYIYCPDERNAGTILELTSITEFDEELLEQGTIKSTASDKFYVNLK